ncbi:hypothetical protein L3X38_029098 [Prunus dulcis]|uniref:Uncharacterized protein n=1 Tax=Prunus dulcis TaxID=3755 RepID=A0AAD4VTG8_PRUDU|nr:hypothetical protein L3X38_029098 [Prunus dulcis]
MYSEPTNLCASQVQWVVGCTGDVQVANPALALTLMAALRNFPEGLSNDNTRGERGPLPSFKGWSQFPDSVVDEHMCTFCCTRVVWTNSTLEEEELKQNNLAFLVQPCQCLGAKLDKVAKQLDDFIDTVVEEHMNHSSRSGYDDQKDFLDILLAIQKENLAGIPIDRVNVKAIILDMFAAGTDTTHTALEWAMTELLRHPRVMNKLQNEVRGIVGNKTDVITEDDLVEMHYLKAVKKETLRLHPPLPLLFPRMSTRDVEVNGYNIKANTQVFINAWQIGRDPKLYDKPEEYEPERFLNNGIDYKGNDFELIPFGAGRRVCPGIQFAMAVNEIALANIVHNFDWALPGEVSGEDLDMTETTDTLASNVPFPRLMVQWVVGCTGDVQVANPALALTLKVEQ